jgi:hypothetical protein
MAEDKNELFYHLFWKILQKNIDNIKNFINSDKGPPAGDLYLQLATFILFSD